MSGVDVVSVMHEAANTLDWASQRCHMDATDEAVELREARDAVAELIAACDAEQMVINDYLLNTCKETWEAYQRAMLRRHAALARVKGHKA